VSLLVLLLVVRWRHGRVALLGEERLNGHWSLSDSYVVDSCGTLFEGAWRKACENLATSRARTSGSCIDMLMAILRVFRRSD
jgi:hypothetical protein